MMTVGEKIKKARKERKITQKRLGELTGLAEITIRKYESGDSTPRYENIVKIATALEVPPYVLTGNLNHMTSSQIEEKLFRELFVSSKESPEKQLEIAQTLSDLLNTQIIEQSVNEKKNHTLTGSDYEALNHFRPLNDPNKKKAIDYMDLLKLSQDTAPDPDHQDTE